LGDIGIDVRITTEGDRKERDVTMFTGFIWLRLGSCEHINERLLP
jgi:hypothetical protein